MIAWAIAAGAIGVLLFMGTLCKDEISTLHAQRDDLQRAFAEAQESWLGEKARLERALRELQSQVHDQSLLLKGFINAQDPATAMSLFELIVRKFSNTSGTGGNALPSSEGTPSNPAEDA